MQIADPTVNGTETSPSWLVRAAVIYLAVPLGIFLLGWFQWWVSVPILSLLLVTLFRWLFDPQRVPERHRQRGSTRLAVIVIVFSIAWTVLGGAGHLFFANWDWLLRDAVLRDLVIGAWPVGYGSLNGAESVLRAPLAYYLPSAMVGKLFGVRAADPALLIWTTIGVGIFFSIVAEQTRSLSAATVTLGVLVFFSGMDVVGTVLRGGLVLAGQSNITDHLEWWATRFQYSSMTTQLFWVPNHALPGWICTALILRNRRDARFLGYLPILLALSLLWSPLITVGLAPLAGWVWLRGLGNQRLAELVNPLAVITALVLLALIGGYLTMGVAAERASWARTGDEPLWLFTSRYIQFVLLECGILWLLLLVARRDGLLFVAGLSLWLIPLVSFGSSNDFVMRASIPALVIVAVLASEMVVERNMALRKRVFWPIVLILLLGAPTAITEMSRALVKPRWEPDTRNNLLEVAAPYQFPWHYVTGLSGVLMPRVLKTIQPLPGTDGGPTDIDGGPAHRAP